MHRICRVRSASIGAAPRRDLSHTTSLMLLILLFFFFQAEDGIRDVAVTGVQTCALPISPRWRRARVTAGSALCATSAPARCSRIQGCPRARPPAPWPAASSRCPARRRPTLLRPSELESPFNLLQPRPALPLARLPYLQDPRLIEPKSATLGFTPEPL